jgi:hypothetical protein
MPSGVLVQAARDESVAAFPEFGPHGIASYALGVES